MSNEPDGPAADGPSARHSAAGAPSLDNIVVAVRARPMNENEAASGSFPCIVVDEDAKHIRVEDPDDKMGGLDYLRIDKHRDKHYAFDHALGPDATQDETFETAVGDLLGEVLGGRNACCFAYGATGSGKTFTMTGNDAAPGLIPHAVDALFTAADAAADECSIECTYVEIYNEQVKDLLEPTNGLLEVRRGPLSLSLFSRPLLPTPLSRRLSAARASRTPALSSPRP